MHLYSFLEYTLPDLERRQAGLTLGLWLEAGLCLASIWERYSAVRICSKAETVAALIRIGIDTE